MRRLEAAVSLGELAGLLGASVASAHFQRPIDRLATLTSAGPTDLSFLSDVRYRQDATRCAAGAVLVRNDDAQVLPDDCAAVVVPDPYLAYARVASWFEQRIRPTPPAGISPAACVSAAAKLGSRVRVDAGASIADGARVGDDVSIGPGCHVGRDAIVGAGSCLTANVVVQADCELGVRVMVHPGTVIGADGFGFARQGEGWQKIAQLGRVVIDDDVEIGANCAIDRGAIDDTRIGRGCKLDNLIQIAHNVVIGPDTAIAGCVGIAGSARIGARCMIGGGAGILGHLAICDDTTISAMSLVTRSIHRPGFYTGVFPLMNNPDWEKAAATLRRLPDLRARLRLLESLTKENP
ncbi:MAG: UDP-3-O-(3-hydroxymyristoyl)glucosamine N-acyltransferase [Burkholderiaceae bacterium]|nr:UDP-3-O-(3-hydroxymyristoyl)glucosamine N-acyltransferase [Burkholderiaceae bacterium]